MVFGVLMGIKSDILTYAMYLEFQITDGWIQPPYRQTSLSWCMMTTSRLTITRSIWLEGQTQYLHIVDSVVTYNIPNELIINVDQTRC